MAGTAFTLHQTIAFRSGLGPYMEEEAAPCEMVTDNPDSAAYEELDSIMRPQGAGPPRGVLEQRLWLGAISNDS